MSSEDGVFPVRAVAKASSCNVVRYPVIVRLQLRWPMSRSVKGHQQRGVDRRSPDDVPITAAASASGMRRRYQ